MPSPSIRRRSVIVCKPSPVVPISPVSTIKSAPVALPVLIPGRRVNDPPDTSVPMPPSPLINPGNGVVPNSPPPTTTFWFLRTIVFSFDIVPTCVTAGSALTFRFVLIVNDVAFSVAPITGHCPSKLLIVLLAIITAVSYTHLRAHET